MNNVKEELYKKLKKMEQEELIQYQKAAKNTNRFLNSAGVALIFGIFIFNFGAISLFFISVIIYFIALLSTGVDNTLSIIDTLIK